MTLYQTFLTLSQSIPKLEGITIAPNGVGHQFQVGNVQKAKTALDEMAIIPGLDTLANQLKEHPVFRNYVQDAFSFQDNDRHTQSASLQNDMRTLIDAARTLHRFSAALLSEQQPHSDEGDAALSVFELKIVGQSTLDQLADKLNETRAIISDAIYLAERGGLIEHASPIEVVAAGTGSIYFDLAGVGVVMVPVVKFVMWIARQGLHLTGEALRQRGELQRQERLGIGKEMLVKQAELHAEYSKLLCRSLAERANLPKPLDPEEQLKLEHAIRRMGTAIANGVRLLDTPSSGASADKLLTEPEYEQIEQTGKEQLQLASGVRENVDSWEK